MAGTQYITRTITQLEYRRQEDVTGTEFEMVEAQFTAQGPQRFQIWEVCPICNFSYPRMKMRKVGETYYCTRFKHYLDKIMEQRGVAVQIS